ncbi:histidine kinase [Cellulomonas algicola]|uniref:histidine kinase n=1 Tax=Cellulomonas algicola TaxID=2071633 RepID=UPI001CED3234|nr:histidine kinase [Cellulomonas algicola]
MSSTAPTPADPADRPTSDQPAPHEPADADAAQPASTAPAQPRPVTPADDEEPPVPSEAELLATARPATVRRAPKYSVFIGAGAIVGIVVGLVLVAVLKDPQVRWIADGTGFVWFLEGEGAVRTVTAVALGVLGGFVGGALAVLADRRSRDPYARRR